MKRASLPPQPCAVLPRSGTPCRHLAVGQVAGVAMCRFHHRLAGREPRSVPLPVRLTVAERQHVDALAKSYGYSASEMARAAILGLSLPPPRVSEGLAAFVEEMRSVGVNLNQVTRALHDDLARGGNPDHAALLGAYQKLADLIRKLRSHVVSP